MPGKPKGLSSQEDALNPEQLRRLMGVCTTVRDRFIVYTLALAGLRVSELTHLRRSWVDFGANTITVPRRQSCSCWECNHTNRQSGVNRNGLWRPKTKQGVRTIALDPQLVPVMREFLAGQDSLGLTRQRVWQILRHLARRAGILGSGYPHSLRATCATVLAFKRISAAGLRYVMGWSGLKVAESYVRSDREQALGELHRIYGDSS